MTIINGQQIAKELREKVKLQVATVEEKVGRAPCLAVVLVGENPASQIYVKNKEKACLECGIKSAKYDYPADITEAQLLGIIEELNQNSKIDGILIQLPLPPHISEEKILNNIAADKDVDGFHPSNLGKLLANSKFGGAVVPCTPKGCMKLIKSTGIDLNGKKAVVIGRSNIVGKPMAQLLLNENCTVTITHSKTRDLASETAEADIVVVAIGKARFLKKDMVKDGAVVIDVGINRLEDGICGDADFENLLDKCSFITPVPKGVGPMTIACLMENTLELFCRHNAIDINQL